MKQKVTALIGIPAAGKSTIMQAFLRTGRWEFHQQPLAHHISRKRGINVLGAYTGHEFPGTDRLSMGIQPRALDFIDQEFHYHSMAHSRVSFLYEGDRLGNGKAFDHFICRGYDLAVGVVWCSGSVIARREASRTQDSTFVAGRVTKVMNLVERFQPFVKMLQNDNMAQLETTLDWLTERHG